MAHSRKFNKDIETARKVNPYRRAKMRIDHVDFDSLDD